MSGVLESFDPVTRQGVSISNLFWLELVISGLLLAMVIGVLAFALVHYRARPGEAGDPPQVHGHRTLEIIWTAAPAATLAIIFILVVMTMRTVDAVEPGARSIVITGHQWWWQYTYPDLQLVTANELHVPVGSPLQISLQSADVIHSFHAPQFGWMQDLVPGKTNQMSVFVERAGIYDGTCNQYCGLQHAWMRLRIVAESPDQFAAWVQQQQQPVALSGVRGEQVFVQSTCVSCHAIRGVSNTGSVGPDLTHVGGRATLGAGVMDNTPDNLRTWIRNAQSVKPGVLMPPFNSLSDADVNALVDYLESLR
ncbi:MAG TPA: cytochrome c oxidase subunit II [Chloroflexota bacterium]